MRVSLLLVLMLAGCAEESEPVESHDCTSLPASDRLDIENGCVEGFCAGQDAADAVQAALGTGTCTAYDYSDDSAHVTHFLTCDLGNGIIVKYLDTNDNHAADYDETVDTFELELPWDGSDQHHLGLDIYTGCYPDVLGDPVINVDNDYGCSSELWWDPLFIVYDAVHNDDGESGCDGLADKLKVY